MTTQCVGIRCRSLRRVSKAERPFKESSLDQLHAPRIWYVLRMAIVVAQNPDYLCFDLLPPDFNRLGNIVFKADSAMNQITEDKQSFGFRLSKELQKTSEIFIKTTFWNRYACSLKCLGLAPMQISYYEGALRRPVERFFGEAPELLSGDFTASVCSHCSRILSILRLRSSVLSRAAVLSR